MSSVPESFLYNGQSIGRVKVLNGEVKLTSANGNTRKLLQQDSLFKDDILVAGEDSHLEIQLADQSQIALHGKLRLKLDQQVLADLDEEIDASDFCTKIADFQNAILRCSDLFTPDFKQTQQPQQEQSQQRETDQETSFQLSEDTASGDDSKIVLLADPHIQLNPEEELEKLTRDEPAATTPTLTLVENIQVQVMLMGDVEMKPGGIARYSVRLLDKSGDEFRIPEGATLTVDISYQGFDADGNGQESNHTKVALITGNSSTSFNLTDKEEGFDQKTQSILVSLVGLVQNKPFISALELAPQHAVRTRIVADSTEPDMDSVALVAAGVYAVIEADQDPVYEGDKVTYTVKLLNELGEPVETGKDTNVILSFANIAQIDEQKILKHQLTIAEGDYSASVILDIYGSTLQQLGCEYLASVEEVRSEEFDSIEYQDFVDSQQQPHYAAIVTQVISTQKTYASVSLKLLMTDDDGHACNQDYMPEMVDDLFFKVVLQTDQGDDLEVQAGSSVNLSYVDVRDPLTTQEDAGQVLIGQLFCAHALEGIEERLGCHQGLMIQPESASFSGFAEYSYDLTPQSLAMQAVDAEMVDEDSGAHLDTQLEAEFSKELELPVVDSEILFDESDMDEGSEIIESYTSSFNEIVTRVDNGHSVQTIIVDSIQTEDQQGLQLKQSEISTTQQQLRFAPTQPVCPYTCNGTAVFYPAVTEHELLACCQGRLNEPVFSIRLLVDSDQPKAYEIIPHRRLDETGESGQDYRLDFALLDKTDQKDRIESMQVLLKSDQDLSPQSSISLDNNLFQDVLSLGDFDTEPLEVESDIENQVSPLLLADPNSPFVQTVGSRAGVDYELSFSYAPSVEYPDNNRILIHWEGYQVLSIDSHFNADDSFLYSVDRGDGKIDAMEASTWADINIDLRASQDKGCLELKRDPGFGSQAELPACIHNLTLTGTMARYESRLNGQGGCINSSAGEVHQARLIWQLDKIRLSNLDPHCILDWRSKDQELMAYLDKQLLLNIKVTDVQAGDYIIRQLGVMPIEHGKVDLQMHLPYQLSWQQNNRDKTADGFLNLSITDTEMPVKVRLEGDTTVDEGGRASFSLNLTDDSGSPVFVPWGESIQIRLEYAESNQRQSPFMAAPVELQIESGQSRVEFGLDMQVGFQVGDCFSVAIKEVNCKLGSFLNLTQDDYQSLVQTRVQEGVEPPLLQADAVVEQVAEKDTASEEESRLDSLILDIDADSLNL